MAARWSPHHQRLHRWLIHHSDRLPDHQPLLLAVSGGQDSMALTGLLQDLQRLHHWPLLLWHGDHGLRPEAQQQAQELHAWAQAHNLEVLVDRWSTPQPSEAAARQWRYSALQAAAQQHGIRHVVTGHTGSDRAETLLLQLARGTHRRGLASLRPQRALGCEGVLLSRPLLIFSRLETAHICQQLELPVWLDESNNTPRFSRNRIRHEVLPVLEQLHPGASRRISGVAERLAQEEQRHQELVHLALAALQPAEDSRTLARKPLMALASANQRLLLQAWLARQGLSLLTAAMLDALLQRLEPQQGPGRCDLNGGRQLHWNRQQIWLEPPAPRRAEMDGTP